MPSFKRLSKVYGLRVFSVSKGGGHYWIGTVGTMGNLNEYLRGWFFLTVWLLFRCFVGLSSLSVELFHTCLQLDQQGIGASHANQTCSLNTHMNSMPPPETMKVLNPFPCR